MKKTHLYILVFPDRAAIKIGKANSIRARANTLVKHWGAIDYNSSYSVELEEKIVFNLETALHRLMSIHAMSYDDGDGKKEFFSIEALGAVLEHVNLFLSANGLPDLLKKGIPLPIINKTVSKQKTQPSQRKNFLADGEAFVNSMQDCISTLKNWFRVINILQYYESKIPFQYDIKEDALLFRIKYKNDMQERLISRMDRYLSFFYVIDISGKQTYWNTTRGELGDREIIQIRIVLKENLHPYETFINQQILSAIKMLPKRSEAAKEALPILEDAPLLLSGPVFS